MHAAQSTELSFAGQDIFVGLDVHVKSWTVSIYTAFFEHKTFNQPPRPELLLRYLDRCFPGARYHAVYEAGYCGFWICEELRRAGVNAVVINPADVPTTNKERTYKTNRVDSRKLARELRSGSLKPIYVASRQALEDRTLVRTRDALVKKQTRVKNQIKGMLAFYGVVLPGETERYWSAGFIRWLSRLSVVGEDPSSMQSESGAQALRHHVEELLHLRGQILEVTRAIRRLSRTEHYRRRVDLLLSLYGIGPLGAMILLSELIDIKRFPGGDELAGFVGLIPSSDDTGEEEHRETLTPRRSPRLRHILIESAWVAVRKDPRLIHDFHRLAQRMKKNEAIIRIARKQLNRIRYVLRNDAPYVSMPLAA
ncbi:MAG: IS110 family transposase [Rhodothermales bacterium]